MTVDSLHDKVERELARYEHPLFRFSIQPAGSGVLLYNAGATYPSAGGIFGAIALSGNGAINLSAPTSGSYAGLVIFQSPVARVIASRQSGDVAAGVVISSSKFQIPLGGPEAEKNAVKESLGSQMIEGVRADRTRTTITIPVGAIGNEQPIQIVSERWYSPELQTVVMTKRNDPRAGETVYHLTNISRTEPPHSLFEAPADYAVEDAQPLMRRKQVGVEHARPDSKD